MKIKKVNIILILLIFVVLFVYINIKIGAKNIVNALLIADKSWILAALFGMCVYWFLESTVLHLITKCVHKKQKFTDTVKVSMAGQFFNCVTPFSSGGQPIQAYRMVKSGISLGNTSIALLIKFIVFQSVLALYCLFVLVFKYAQFAAEIKNFKYLLIFGFVVNFIVMFALISLCVFDKTALKLIKKILYFLGKHKLVKDYENRIDKIENEIKIFNKGTRTIIKNRASIVIAGIITVIQLTIFFSIPFFVYMAYNGDVNSAFMLITAGACILMITSFVPSPGASGGAEISSLAMLGMFFPSDILPVAMLLWRFITFYFQIGIGALFTFSWSHKKNS